MSKKDSTYLKLKKLWKDPKGKAKIELSLYALFFIGVIVFVRILGSSSSDNGLDNNLNSTSFINTISDNYEYYMEITVNDDPYKYHGKRLGHNSSVTRENNEQLIFYYIKDDKYYILDENGNSLLTNEKDTFPHIDAKLLNINNIKEYIKLGIKKDGYYEIDLAKIVLNYTGTDKIIVSIDEEDQEIIVDYTSLFKLDDPSINEVKVKFNFYDIDKIMTLEE